MVVKYEMLYTNVGRRLKRVGGHDHKRGRAADAKQSRPLYRSRNPQYFRRETELLKGNMSKRW